MKDRQRKKWEKLRIKGKKKFVIYNGILGWGVPTAILFTLAMTFLDSYSVQLDKGFFQTTNYFNNSLSIRRNLFGVMGMGLV